MASSSGQIGNPAEPGVQAPASARGHQAAPEREGGRVGRALAIAAVGAGLAGLTAAACLLSYSSMHALAGQAGVPAEQARWYPLVIDAMLVIAGCSVLALRGAGLVSRLYAWLCFLLLLVGLAAGSAAHAAGRAVPRQQAEIGAAVIPFGLVLAGFGLLLALLRHARRRKARRAGAGEIMAGLAPAAAAETRRALIPGMAARGSAPVQVIPAQSTPQEAVSPAPVRIEQVKRGADTAEMRLRARIPRPAPSDEKPESGPAADAAPADQAAASRGTSSPRKAEGDPAAGPAEPPAVGAEVAAGGPAGSEPADAVVLDGKRPSGAAGLAKTAGAASSPAAPATSATDAATQAGAGSPPAFRRPRSSPTPPEG